MGAKTRKKPESRVLIIQVRPRKDAPVWWPKAEKPDADGNPHAWATIDPYEPPSWTLSPDEEYEFDTLELWNQLKISVEEWIEHIREEWLEEFGPEDYDPEDGTPSEGPEWEFKQVAR